MKKTVLILMILTIFSKFIGFFREITLAYFYGAYSISDTYLIALTIPTVIFAFVGVGISTTFIPMFSQTLREEGEYRSTLFTNNVVNFSLVVSSLVVICVLIFTEPIVKGFASGFEGETLVLAINLTRVTIFSVFFTGIIYIFNGYLQVKNIFTLPALIGLPLNLFLICSIALSTITGLKVLSYGSILAVLAQLLFLLPFLIKQGYKYKFILQFKDPKLQRMIYLSTPVILGTSVNQINVLIDRTLASRVSVGGISSLNYAHQINQFVQGIIVMSIATVLFATISKMAADKNITGIKNALETSINGINLLVLPATIGTMIFAEPIVSLLFQRGEFNSKAVTMTSELLFFYSIGMIALGLREVLSRTFYSLQDTKTPMTNATLGVGLNVILNLILVAYLGLGGLALATSIAAFFTMIFMFISLRKKIGPFGMKQIAITFLKILFASLVMGALAKLSFNYLTTTLSQNLSLLISIILGVLSYFLIIYFMKIEDVNVIANAIKKKLGEALSKITAKVK